VKIEEFSKRKYYKNRSNFPGGTKYYKTNYKNFQEGLLQKNSRELKNTTRPPNT